MAAIEEKVEKQEATEMDTSEPKAPGQALEADPTAKEAPKEPEPEKELEADAPAAKGKAIAEDAAVFRTEDTTLNTLLVQGGKMMTALNDNGFNYLMAGLRCSVGIKKGRYMYEAVITEARTPFDPCGSRAPTPVQLVRLGFATAGADLLLLDEESVSFDSEGVFAHGGKSDKVIKARFTKGQIVAVVLNLDPSSPNANTISLFKNGLRVSPPQKLPEAMVGKTLYPSISFKNVTMQVHFGPEPMLKLPFVCRTLQEASASDVVVEKGEPKDGKFDVVYPVGLPNEGLFEWVDRFVASSKGKRFQEISDRRLIEWARKSGVQRRNGYGWRQCNDKPELGLSGLNLLEALSTDKSLADMAAMMPRHFVLAEVKENLTTAGRASALARYPATDFNRVCKVLMGEPPADVQEHARQALLNEKQAKAEKEAAAKKAELDRKRKAEEDQKKKELALKKLRDARDAKAKAEKQEKEEEKKDGEEKAEEEKKDTEEKEAEESKAAEEEKKDEPMPEAEPEVEEEVKVELTAEEAKIWFPKSQIPDLTGKEMCSFATFSLPTKDEGFDTVDFEWQKTKAVEDYFKAWLTDKKLTQRVEDLKPSDWHKSEVSKWKKQVTDWKQKQGAWGNPAMRKAALAKKRAAAKSEAAADAKDGEEKAAEAAEGEEKAEQNGEEEVPESTAADLDVFKVKDVNDCGNGEPLCANFDFEDWKLLELRYELHLMTHSFRREFQEQDRTQFPLDHVAFYYQKYFWTPLVAKAYSCVDIKTMVELLEDALEIGEKTVMKSLLAEDTPLDNFLRLTEDHRRMRQRRVDAGDESAQLKFGDGQKGGCAGRGGVKGGVVGAGYQGQKGSGKVLDIRGMTPFKGDASKGSAPSKGGGAKGSGPAPVGRAPYGGGKNAATGLPAPAPRLGGEAKGYGGKGGKDTGGRMLSPGAERGEKGFGAPGRLTSPGAERPSYGGGFGERSFGKGKRPMGGEGEPAFKRAKGDFGKDYGAKGGYGKDSKGPAPYGKAGKGMKGPGGGMKGPSGGGGMKGPSGGGGMKGPVRGYGKK